MKCDGTRAETRFPLSPKWASPFKSAGASVQSTTGSRGVCIRGSNAGYTMFRGSVKSTATHSIHQFPRHFPVGHRVPSHFEWTLPTYIYHCTFKSYINYLRSTGGLKTDKVLLGGTVNGINGIGYLVVFVCIVFL